MLDAAGGSVATVWYCEVRKSFRSLGKIREESLLKSQDKWNCPGMGHLRTYGKFYFLYHAYDATSTVYAGRQGVLSEFTFTTDGWIAFKDVDLKKETIPV